MMRGAHGREDVVPGELAGEEVGAEHREAGAEHDRERRRSRRAISPTARTSGQPGVYCEKYIPSCTPVSQGWKNRGAPPPDVRICPDRSARTVHR